METSWDLILCCRYEICDEALGGHWWRCNLRCSRSPRIVEVMDRSWVLGPCANIRIPEHSSGRAVGESTIQWQQRTQYFGDVSYKKWASRATSDGREQAGTLEISCVASALWCTEYYEWFLNTMLEKKIILLSFCFCLLWLKQCPLGVRQCLT